MIEINLIRNSSARSSSSRGFPSVLGLVLLFGLLTIAVGVLFWRQQLRNFRAEQTALLQPLESQSLRLQRTRSKIAEYRARKDLLDRQAATIRSLVLHRSSPLAMMHAIQKSIPQRSALWLQSLNQAGRRVTIDGEALEVSSVGEFVTRLGMRDTFREVDLDSWERTNDSVRFQLSFTLREP